MTGDDRDYLVAGDMLAHYKVIERLASGGMGEIYIAEDTRLGRRVALKVLPAEAVADAERLQRFQAEARAVAAMNHPNIVTIHGVETDRGIHFIAMELVEGKTLRKVIPKGGLPLPEFFRIAEQLTAAVAVAHESGITHRDLKPDNVMVTPSGHVKVLDFGLAKLVDEPADPAFDGPTRVDSDKIPSPNLTEDGALLGTVPYMSPEHVTGRGFDHRSDIFSLGIILYEMLTGERPFHGSTSTSMMSAILRKPAEPIARRRTDIPRSIELAIELCLEKDPADRMQQTSALHEQLRIARREISSASRVSDTGEARHVSRPPSVVVRSVHGARSLASRHRLPLLLLATVFLVNFLETTVEAAIRDRWGVGRELGYQLARAAHWFEGATDGRGLRSRLAGPRLRLLERLLLRHAGPGRRHRLGAGPSPGARAISGLRSRRDRGLRDQPALLSLFSGPRAVGLSRIRRHPAVGSVGAQADRGLQADLRSRQLFPKLPRLADGGDGRARLPLPASLPLERSVDRVSHHPFDLGAGNPLADRHRGRSRNRHPRGHHRPVDGSIHHLAPTRMNKGGLDAAKMPPGFP